MKLIEDLLGRIRLLAFLQLFLDDMDNELLDAAVSGRLRRLLRP